MAVRIWLVALSTISACKGKGNTTTGDTDDPTLPEADADTDTDADADADADTDTDTDTDVIYIPPLTCGDASLGFPPSVVSASTVGETDDFTPLGCFGVAGDGEDYTYEFVAPSTGRFLFELDPAATTFDSILYVLDSCTTGNELACDDFFDVGNLYGGEQVGVDLAVGQLVVVVVDSYDAPGDFTLSVSEVTTLELDCFDGLDNDYDFAPDCLDADCDADPACFEDCADGIDNNGDFLVDCLDADCTAAASCQPGCPDVSMVAFGSISSSTLGLPNESQGSCDLSAPSPDASIAFTAPVDGTYAFGLDIYNTDFDAVLYLLDTCGGFELTGGCVDTFDLAAGGGETLSLAMTAGQTVVVTVDGYNTETGNFTLEVFTPVTFEIGLCDNGIDDDLDGLPDCYDGECVGVSSCVEICGDGFDNDGDHLSDCADRECADLPGCVELDCLDGLDNDGDNFFDCSDLDCAADPSCIEISCTDDVDNNYNSYVDCLDTSCLAEAVCTETCPEFDLGSVVPNTFVGNTLGAADDLQGSCVFPSISSDTTFLFTAPAAGNYTFDTIGSAMDSVIYALDGGCGGAELACNDDVYYVGGPSSVTVTLAAGQSVVLVVDGYNTLSSGDYVLNVSQ